MAVSTIVKNFTGGSITFADGTGTPVTKTLDYDNGDFSSTGIKETLNETTVYERRGKRCGVPRHTTRVYPTISFTGKMTQFTDAANGTMTDFLLRTTGSAYASNISTGGANADVYTIDITFTSAGAALGDAADHTFTCADCEATIDFAEGDSNAFTLNFTVYGAITGDLEASEIS